MGKDPYGRPYRRRKAARFSPGLLCSICGKPILTFAEYTLHHVVAVSDGGGPFDEQPAHKACNVRHGGQLGAKRSRRDSDDLEPVSASAPPRPRKRSGYSKVSEGAIRIPLDGPVEVHHADGTVTRVPRGRHYVP